MRLQKRYLGDITGIVISLVILVLVIVGTLVLFNTPERARGSIQNQGADGVSLFADWLAGRGFVLRSLNTPDSVPLREDSVLFVIAPRSGFERLSRAWLDVWVQNGGTLVVAQENRHPSDLLRPFGAGIGRLWLPVPRSELQLPTFNWPPVGQAAIGASHFVKVSCGRTAVHMGDCRRPLLAAWGHGRGRVFVLSSATPFTNEGLQDAGNAQLVENLVLSTAVPGQRIVFDELHHQVPMTWLFTTPTGWAFWLSLLALIGFFMWHNSTVPAGHVPGQPVTPVWAEADTAVAINYLASASRQFSRYETITDHYWQRLKRSLARRYGLDSALLDHQFVEMLKPYVTSVEMGTLVYLSTQRERAPVMTGAELRQWVSVAINISDRQPLTREVYEYQKTV